MIFAVNIGNTVTTFGAASSPRNIVFRRTDTADTWTDLEFLLTFRAFLEKEGLAPADFEGSVLSCVVPPLKNVLVRALKRLFGKAPLTVDASCAFGYTIGLKNRQELGVNLITLSNAVVKDYGVPAILINVGTATSVGVIDENAVFRGGVLYPGMQNALDALIAHTSLPPIKIEGTVELTGKNTFDSIRCGVLYGHAGAVDRILDELLETVPGAVIVASGKRAPVLTSVLKHRVIYDDTLMMRGLYYTYRGKEGKDDPDR